MKTNVVRYLMFGLLLALLLSSGCLSDNGGETTTTTAHGSTTTTAPDSTGAYVEVIHFHRTSQCWTCKTVGAYAEETVNTYFSEEVRSGKLVFKHLNTDLPENLEVFRRYGTTTPSLCIGVYNKDGFHAEENMNVWYKVNNKEDYMTYLKGIIEKKLEGEVA